MNTFFKRKLLAAFNNDPNQDVKVTFCVISTNERKDEGVNDKY